VGLPAEPGAFVGVAAFAEPRGTGGRVASEAWATAAINSRLAAGNHGDRTVRKTVMYNLGKGATGYQGDEFIV
jgi:hypothetical protein